MTNDRADALRYFGSVTGRIRSWSPSVAQMQINPYGKSSVINQWAERKYQATLRRLRDYIWDFNPVFAVRTPDTNAMARALKRLRSKHRPRFIQMSYSQKLVFITRVKRHGQKQYPNQQHMRDIYAQFIAERVSAELKD